LPQGNEQEQTVPSRVIEYEAVWQSDKLADLPAFAQPEYVWCYGLADSNGVLELSNLRAVHHRVYAIRPTFPFSQFKRLIQLFEDVGLLFIWEVNTKRFGYWTAAERRGRLPSLSTRGRYSPLGILPPADKLKAFYKKFGIREVGTDSSVATESRVNRESLANDSRTTHDTTESRSNHDSIVTGVGVGLGVGLGVGVGLEDKALPPAAAEHPSAGEVLPDEVAAQPALIPDSRLRPSDLVECWNAHCGSLPKVKTLTEERARRAKALIRSSGFSLDDFQKVVLRAARSPFLSGAGAAGWRADFDFVLNPTNCTKILEGSYDDRNGKSGDRINRMVASLREEHKAMH
jgi:hypothetical protein